MAESDPKGFKQTCGFSYCSSHVFTAFPFNTRFKFKCHFQRNSYDNLW